MPTDSMFNQGDLGQADYDGGMSAPGDGDLSDGFQPEAEKDSDFGDLQGYKDLNPDIDGDEDESGSSFFPGATLKKTRPAFFSGSIAKAERSAIRTQASNAEAFELIEDAHAVAVPPRLPGAFGHSIRRKGASKGDTLISCHKPVTADVDSDDEILLDMREKGYTDQQIVDRLAREGRAHYDRKSVSTRIARIRLAQAAHVDTLLENGYKEWEFEDDLRLMQALEYASMEVEYEIERARAWRFKKVSEFMRKLDKDSIWSEKACRQRYQALVEGTATIPIDMADDPDARRAEMEAFREQRESERAAERVKKDAEKERERRIKEEARMRNAIKAEEVARRRAAQQAQRSQRMMDRTAQNQAKLQRAEQNRLAKIRTVERLKAEKIAEKEAAEKAVRESNQNAKLKVTFVKQTTTITADTKDPHSDLSMADLQHLCGKRGVSVSDDMTEMVGLLKEKDAKRSISELRQLSRMKGLNTAGSKAVLNHQLAEAEASEYPSYPSAI